MKKITVIIPCLNEEDALPIYYKEMSKIMKQMKETEIEWFHRPDAFGHERSA